MIYLDNCATTKIHPLVLKEMLPYLENNYGNAHSYHSLGFKATEAVEKAREQVAKCINASPNQIIFTSGATESNNIILSHFSNKEIISSVLEHSSVYNPIYYKCPWRTFCKSKENGQIDFVYKENAFYSIMKVNNEIGTVNSNVPSKNLHMDATQALGKIKFDISECFSASFSSHKIYGPKGVGCLYVKDYSSIEPLMYGGKQEFGLRSGTLNVAGIVGFGKACEILEINENIIDLKNAFLNEIGNMKILNFPTQIPNIINITLPTQDVLGFLNRIENRVALSVGSACLSFSTPSRILTEIGLTEEEALKTIRISIGNFNTKEEMIKAARIIKKSI